MMHQSGEFSYKENDLYQAVSLPYGKGRMSMYVFLPAEGSKLDDFYRGLSSDAWNEWVTGFQRREGSLAVPRFTLEYAVRLKGILIALGMGKAFSPTEADFSAMCTVHEQNVYIDDVLHKTFIEVNEEGTEAAAVTAVKMKLTAVAEKPEPFQMIVDRPFFVVIRDNETGLVLFMGSIVEPDTK
jgi:serpin B